MKLRAEVSRAWVLVAMVCLCTTVPAAADELTQMVQKDLVALGYDPGSISGDTSVTTAVAISKFQAENGLQVTGEASPQLAGILEAKVGALRSGSGAAPAKAAAATPAPATAPPAGAAALAAAAPAQTPAASGCLRDTANEAAQGTRKLGRLAAVGGRLFGRLGGGDAAVKAAEAAQTANDVADAASAVGDLSDCQPSP
jgi:Putative peptidoglycan binding domain